MMAIVARRLVGAVAVLILATSGCSSPTQPAVEGHATLEAGPVESGECSPERLSRCVPRLTDLDEGSFDGVTVYPRDRDVVAVSPGAKRDAAPQECQDLPRFSAAADSTLGVDYQPAVDAQGNRTGDRFPPRGSDALHLRLLPAGTGTRTDGLMDDWARRCPMWGITPTLNDGGIRGWQLAESPEALARYRAGDVDHQWPHVAHVAWTTLPNGVVAQAWYRTSDPSEASRNHVLAQLLRAVGRPRPVPAPPTDLDRWSRAQIATLLPALSADTGIDAGIREGVAASDAPGNQSWSLCEYGDQHPAAPPLDPVAAWQTFDQSTWDRPDGPPRPFVMIKRARPGVDYLAELERQIATCTAHLKDEPTLCAKRDDRQYLRSDKAVADGRDVLRIEHRWLRSGSLRGYPACFEGVEALRVSQLRGLVVITSAEDGGYLFHGDGRPLPLSTLDQLLAQTVRSIAAA